MASGAAPDVSKPPEEKPGVGVEVNKTQSNR